MRSNSVGGAVVHGVRNGVTGHQTGGDFGARLRGWRRARGFTQERLAEVSGLSVRALRDMERGRVRAPQRRTAQILADTLDLSEEDRHGLLALTGAARARAQAAGCGAPGCETARATEALPRTPNELPPAINDLTGRDDDLAALSELALPASSEGASRVGPVVAVLHGPPGIGKTSLAINAAYRMRDRFPDGQLFVDLLGGVGGRLDPIEVLGRFLRSLGAPGRQLPATLAERTALYRTMTHDRRLVVVLDNAADEAQVRPLLPASAGCFVLVSSRRPLTGLDAVDRLAPALLTRAAGEGLLRAILGERARAEPAATKELIELCGYLPLALRVAGNWLAGRPAYAVRRLVAQLRDERQRLGALTAGDRGVRAAFAVSYGQLSSRTATMFRRCALLTHPTFDTALAAVVADLSEDDATAALDELVDAGLLHVAGERYRFHDLVRLYSQERLETDEPVQAVVAARDRTITWLLDQVVATAPTLEPFNDPTDDSRLAAAWLEQEFPHWWHALRLAACLGWHANVVRVVRALHWYSDTADYRHPWVEVFTLGVDSARALGDRQSEAVLSNFLAWALYRCRERYADALAAVGRAEALALSCGDRREEAWALTYRAAILPLLGDARGALAPARQAARLFGELGYRPGAMSARHKLATAYAELGDFARALDIHEEMLAFHRDDNGLGGAARRRVEALALIDVGRDLAGLGRWPAAERAYAEAVELSAHAGDRFGEGQATYYLALARRALGDEAAAASGLRSAAERFTAAHSTTWAERARLALAAH